MNLELHQIDRRYEALRRATPERDQRVLASLARSGQQTPVVVVPACEPDRFVLVDGYKRVRALTRLREDVVRATCWSLPESEALLLERLMRTGSEDAPLEQGWLLCELRDRFGFSAAELARRFDKTASWVSRRLALVADLPEPIQAHVRRSDISAYAAMKFLVPLARANKDDCVRLAAAIAPLRPTTRQTAVLCSAFQTGSAKTREIVLSDPALLLRVREQAAQPVHKDPAALLIGDLDGIGGLARRAHRRMQEGFTNQLTPHELDGLRRCAQQVRADVAQLFERFEKEVL